MPATAQKGDVVVGKAPGVAGMMQTVTLSATITAIDPATRVVTLRGPKGNELSVTAGPEVRNFAQLKVGDNVEVGYVEALVLELKKGGGAPVARTERAGGAGAKPGAAPGAAGGRQVTVVGDVVGVDEATQTVTVRGPQRTIELKVRDPEQRKLIAKGDQIQATYTEAVAVSVAPAKK
jgi:hypothetical protein